MSDDWAAFIETRRNASPSTREPELLFEFLRASDRAPMAAWLKFRGESYGWEVQLFERGELFASHGGFATRELAVAWAVQERKAMER